MNLQYNIKAITYFKKSNCFFYSSSKSVFSNKELSKKLYSSFYCNKKEQIFAKSVVKKLEI